MTQFEMKKKPNSTLRFIWQILRLKSNAYKRMKKSEVKNKGCNIYIKYNISRMNYHHLKNDAAEDTLATKSRGFGSESLKCKARS